MTIQKRAKALKQNKNCIRLKRFWTDWKLPIILFLSVFSLWLFSWYYLHDYSDQQRGTFGDMFGGVNALFSGLAFAGVIYAILLQRKELELQREELILTRGELSGQREEFKLQNETLKRQNFEDAFFKLISLYNDVVLQVSCPRSDKPDYIGKSAMQRLVIKLENRIKGSGFGHNPKGTIYNKKEVLAAYTKFYEDYDAQLGHYFRVLYRIFKLLKDKKEQDEEFDDVYYAKIVRSLLSNDELVLLFFNCAFYGEGLKFKPLLERYEVFDNLPLSKLEDLEEFIIEYDQNAYGQNVPMIEAYIKFEAEADGVKL
ncbi:MAG: putative phage abortive infection protein [Micavibrio sp.]|nr:putative phage abortive infection protein [Micavibrio sp.]